MIHGVVNFRSEAVVPLNLRGPAGLTVMIDAVIDTGFSGILTLPKAIIRSLGLAHLGGGRIFLANGDRHMFEIYSVEVFWDGIWLAVNAAAMGTDSLVGVALLNGYGLTAQFQSNGVVELAKLP